MAAIRCDVTVADEVQAALALAVDSSVDSMSRSTTPASSSGPTPPPTSRRTVGQDHRGQSARGLRRMRHEIPLLLERGGGAIVNTSSGAGLKGFAGGAAYGASKYGVIGATKCAALDYAADDIRINAICPGIIDTDMIDRFSGDTPTGRARCSDQEPIGRMGRPDEIADAVLWLCSDEATFAVGHALVIDGGQTV